MSMHSNSGVSSETFQKYPTQSEEYERDYYFNGGQSNPPPLKTLGSGVYRVYRARPEPSLDSSFPILTMVLLGIVVIAVFLLSYYIFVIKCRFNWQQLVFLRRFSTLQIPRHEDPRIIVYAPARENHGLDESVIRSIPTVKFKNNDVNLHVCAVCLNEFQENEKLRLLPTCKHAFHIDCIDIWLQTNSNCPLCRSEISRTSPWISIQNPVQNLHEVAINVDDNLNSIVIDVNLQSRPGETGSSPETPLQIANRNSSKIEQKSSFKKQRKLYQTSSMGDECIDTREKNDLFQVQTIRRSFSMDSCSDRQLYVSIQEALQQNRSLHEVCSSECSSRFRRSLFSFGQNRGSKFAILPVHTDL